jgi:hypothetical protein
MITIPNYIGTMEWWSDGLKKNNTPILHCSNLKT